MSQRIFLVRHCSSAGQGPDMELAPEGFEQSRALVPVLAELEPDLLISSPYRRARQTIEPFAEASGLELELDERLVERRLSAEPMEDWLQALERCWRDPDLRFPGGESSREATARGRQALASLATRQERRIVLVSHGNWIALLLHSFDGGYAFDAWKALLNPDVIQLEVEAGTGGQGATITLLSDRVRGFARNPLADLAAAGKL